jgi:hypothetical protein
MLARRALLGCLLSLSVGLPIAQAGKDDDDLAPTKGRKLDTDSPVAKALDELLRVDPRYAEDGTVELVYDFTDDDQIEDWTLEGLDRAEEANARGGKGRRIRSGARAPQALSLGAGSAAQGLFVHRLEMKGDYEAVFRCHLERTTTRSDLVFLAGKAGASWGTQLVARGGRGFSPAPGSTRSAVDKEPWTGGRVVTVTLASKAGELTVSVNGARIDGTKRFDADKLDGRVGIFLSDMHLIVHRVVIRGAVNPAKL